MFSFLFPLIKSDFSFSQLNMTDGVFLVDISNDKNWRSKRIKCTNNVGVLLTPKIAGSRIGGNSDVETSMDILIQYCFLKTQLTYSVDECYEVKLDKNNKLIAISDSPIDCFDKYGWALTSYYNFVFGMDRKNLLTKDLFNKIKEGRKNFSEYRHLVSARIGSTMKSPLGVAMNIFDAAFANEGQDDPKYILAVSALESLFSISSSEVAHRLSSNIAWFLYPNPSDYSKRIQELERVKNLYNLRSRLVHGEFQEIEPQSYDSILNLLSTIVQKIIEEYKFTNAFLDEKKHKEFIKNLEVGHLLLT